MDSKYITIKLISGEEVIASYLSETDYEVSVMFPMVVKFIPRFQGSRMMEQITLAPFTYFSIDDEMTFSKSFIIFQKELNPKFIQHYESAVDDFLGREQQEPDSPATVEELKQLTAKLESMFRNNIEDEFDIDEDKTFNTLDISKLIH